MPTLANCGIKTNIYQPEKAGIYIWLQGYKLSLTYRPLAALGLISGYCILSCVDSVASRSRSSSMLGPADRLKEAVERRL